MSITNNDPVTQTFTIVDWRGNPLGTIEAKDQHDALEKLVASGADLNGADLVGAYLRGTDLVGAYLRGANLRGANLSDANLRVANLSGANLRGANLSDANLRVANLRGANLRGANLSDANLSDANLSDANLRGANLSDANLRDAKINWSSHDLLAEILRRAAGDDVEKRKFAGLVLISHGWCWKHFLALHDPLEGWALDALAEYVQDGDSAPAVLRERKEKTA